MPLPLLPPAHRFAQINHLTRTSFFGYAFLVVAALELERGVGFWVFFFALLAFVAYPQLAYLHARIAVDSKRAEFNNLSADSVLLGAWAAQMSFSLWPTCGVLVAISLNNATSGGVRRLLTGFLCFAGGAGVWGAVQGYRFVPATGAAVTGLCFIGIVVYVSTLGLMFFRQNRRLVRTRNVLRNSDEQFRFIAERAGDLVAVLDPDGRIRYASPSHREHFEPDGYAEGRDWLGLVHPEDRVRAGRFLHLLTASPQSERVQLRMTAAKGPWRVVECEGNGVMEDSGGKKQMIVIICRDLTARARAEIDIRLAARAFERLADPALICDDTGCIEFVNEAYTRLMGYSSEELVGRSIKEFGAGAKSEGLVAEIWKSVERDGSWRGKLAERTKTEQPMLLSAQISAVRDRNGVAAHYVWIIGDSEPGERDVRVA